MFWEDLVEHAIAPLNHAGNRTQRATRLVLRDVYTTREGLAVRHAHQRSNARDTKHVLEECSRSRRERLALYNNLNRLGIQSPNTKVLLVGGAFDPETQHEIRWLNTSYPVQALLI